MATSPPKKHNILLLGAGLIGPRHAASIQQTPSLNLYALIEPSSHGPDIAASLNILHYPSVSSFFSHPPPKIAAAIICTPNQTHAPLALELIEHGVKVLLIEKPISTSIEEGKILLETAKEKGVKILVGHHRRFNPYLCAAKSILTSPPPSPSSSTSTESGKGLGRITAIQGTWALKKTPSYFEGAGSWRRDVKQGGGVVLINLIHEIDLLQYLLGPITYVSALSTLNTRPAPPGSN